jgi:hypothetical protein
MLCLLLTLTLPMLVMKVVTSLAMISWDLTSHATSCMRHINMHM